MKRISPYIIAAFTILAAAGCKEKETPVDYNIFIVGDWRFMPEEFDEETTKVHLSFMEDNGFDLYQKIGDGRYRHYSGRWEVKGNTLSGEYSAGTSWGSSYALTSIGTDTLVMTALNGSEDVMKYAREAIPVEITDDATDVKSADPDNDRPVL